MLLSVLLSGVVLVAFGIGTRYALYQLKLRAIDQSLRMAPVPEFPHPQEARVWNRVSQMMDQFSGDFFGGRVSIYVYGVENKIYYQAENWPAFIDLADLPRVEGELLEREPRPRRGERLEDFRERFQRGVGIRPGPLLRGRAGGPRGLRDPDMITAKSSGREFRVGVYKQPGYNIAIAVDLTRVRSDVGNLSYAFYWALPVALVILAGGSWFIASRAIKPVTTLATTAKSVSADRLDHRIAKANEDAEFSDLIDVFNEMLERLERSFAQATRFSADAAHELKTPLAILQVNIESALQRAVDGSEQQKELGMLLDETQRLKSITSKLLILSKADAGTLSAKLEKVDTKPLLSELVEDFEMQSPEVKFHRKIESYQVLADTSFFIRIAQNLLSNAIKYNDQTVPEIWISCIENKGKVVIEVESAGELVSEERREELFDRFRRTDDSRNRTVDGLGLGLSLSREYAKAMNSTLDWIESPNHRNCFALTLERIG